MKNFKLLLATTAMLSMGAMAANAETGNFSITAQAAFTSPIQASTSYIQFGLLDPVVGGNVIVNPDGTFEGNAVLTPVGNALSPQAGSVTLYGGAISGYSSSAYFTTNDQIVLDFTEQENIELRENGTPSGKLCGYVDTFTEGTREITSVSGKKGVRIPLGATLNIVENYTPTSDVQYCMGSMTVTYILNPHD